MTAACTLDDLPRLLDVVRSLPAEHLPAEQLARCESFLVTSIDTRLVQKGQQPTGYHQQLMDAYRASVAKWTLDRENFSNGHAAEQAEWDTLHPRPTLKAFMLQHRQAHAGAVQVCPLCGAELGQDLRMAS